MAEVIELGHVAMAVLAVLALMAANALFVAAEFSIVTAPPHAIRNRAQAGSRAARLVEWVQSDGSRQDRFIATAQLGITATSLGLGMVGESILAERIGAIVGATARSLRTITV